VAVGLHRDGRWGFEPGRGRALQGREPGEGPRGGGEQGGDPLGLEAAPQQRSVLAAFPVVGEIPGLIGWFQIDAAGRLSTPLLPPAGRDAAAYGIGLKELLGRRALERRIASILERNTLVERPSMSDMPAPSAPAVRQQTAPGSHTARRDGGLAPAFPPGRSEGQAIFEQLYPSSDTEAAADQEDEQRQTGTLHGWIQGLCARPRIRRPSRPLARPTKGPSRCAAFAASRQRFQS
jgi:hypothetical protein